MPKKDIAITDTSVLIAFEKLNLLSSLCTIYDEIYLTKAVHNEFDCDNPKMTPLKGL